MLRHSLHPESNSRKIPELRGLTIAHIEEIFPILSKLKIHLKIDTGENLYPCSDCGKTRQNIKGSDSSTLERSPTPVLTVRIFSPSRAT
jgi:hypothetical protein